jgi:VWFA-related protein
MRQAVFISLLLSAMLPIGKTCPCSQKENLANIDEAIKLGVELVVLDAHVMNKRTGRLIGGLRKDHFAIFEDEVRQQITHFSQDVLPLSIIILIDTSSSVWRFISQIRQGALRSLEHLKPEDEVALIATAARTELVQDFTTNKRLIAERIKSLDEKALGDDGILLHEAIYQAASHFRNASNPNYRRAIIAITDDLTTQRRDSQGHSEKEAFDELYESGVAVCGLLTGDYAIKKRIESYYKMKWYDPLGNIAKKTGLMKSPFGPGSILTYARDTGGVVKEVEKDDASAKLTEIIIQLRSRYSFGYVSSKAKMDGKFRKIRLTVSSDIEKRERGLAIITRKGYFARAGASVR